MLADQLRLTRLASTESTRRPTGAVGGCVSTVFATISIDARFQRSFAGAVAPSAIGVPAAAVVAVCRWTQKVSPTEARNSATFVWPGPTVRAVARSQSLPAPQTQDPGRVVVSETLGAPVAPFAVPVAPSAAVSAPVNVATVIVPW